jgi:dTDP-4-amino-4,6-dideoxygalactose transaminase
MSRAAKPRRHAAQPAILGGPKAVTLDGTAANRWPIITGEDRAAVLKVMQDGDLSLHPVTRLLEDDYRAFFGVQHAQAHCNGTAALLAAFFALDLKPGDEVLVPSATFWASVVPMLWVGAVPVFCESEPERLGLDPADVARKITPRTRAIVVVHLFGMPSAMTALLDLARRHNLAIVEDASHAQGATWRGRKCGTLGDIAVFSLQSSKLAPAGEGGMFLTNNDTYAERAVCLGDMVRVLELGADNAASRFAGTTFGIKTRLAPLSAAVARVQLRHLPRRNARRNANLEYLSGRLERLGFHTYLPPSHVTRVYFEYLIRYDAQRSRLPIATFIAALRAEGCDVSHPRYPLLHQQPLFTEGHFLRIARLNGVAGITPPVYRPDALPQTEAVNAQLLKLPAFPVAGRRLLDQYAQAFEKVTAHAEEIAANVTQTRRHACRHGCLDISASDATMLI